RWATHGPATDANAHPHTDSDGAIAVVHNGVIENYAQLKQQLLEEGVVFRSSTDTEVIAHLIARCLKHDLVEAVQEALSLLRGTYGLAVISPRFTEIVGACLSSPLVVGLGKNEYFLASDAGALVGMADRVIYLEDRQLCVLVADEWRIVDGGRTCVKACVRQLDDVATDRDKGKFPHYMLKEMHD